MSAQAWRALGVLALVAALIAGYTALIHHERGIGYDRCVSEAKEKENAELQAARAETMRLFALYDKALQEGAEREQEFTRQRERADLAADRLRGDLADYRRRLSGLTVEACRAYADTGLRLLGECQDRYRAMAERATGHFNDWKTLDEGWPQ
ncbi:MAG: hypothetical protein KA223_04590 [Candidatus Accumulibacter sp.]|nr:hypothetical protein [Accumulibacter sp.]